jgi:hypothetical protein
MTISRGRGSHASAVAAIAAARAARALPTYVVMVASRANLTEVDRHAALL